MTQLSSSNYLATKTRYPLLYRGLHTTEIPRLSTHYVQRQINVGGSPPTLKLRWIKIPPVPTESERMSGSLYSAVLATPKTS